MRYLYGDSAPFPHPFNFLATLEVFMATAARVVALESEARALQMSAATGAAERVRSLEGLESFHDAVMRAIQDAAQRNVSQQAADYARQVAEHAQRIVEDAKRAVQASIERDQAGVRMDVDRRRNDVRAAVETFLINGRLPILGAAVSLHLHEGHYVCSAQLVNPDGIVCAFQLGAGRTPGWHLPRKVGDLTQGVSLLVGLKKSFFSRSVQPELVVVDEYILSGIQLHDTSCELRLRKKALERDSLVFYLHSTEGGLFAEVSHPQEEGSEGHRSPCDVNDFVHLQRLWDALRHAVAPMLETRERVLWLKLEEEDVLENDLAILFIERVIRFLAPVISEIARRSPNPAELSLKMENDNGRREEIYVKKAELTSQIMLLGERERAVFAPLGLGVAGARAGDDVALEDWDGA